MGLMGGAILALYYRKTGPQRIKYDWENEDEDEPDEPKNNDVTDVDHSRNTTGSSDVIYHYKKDP
jgi:hypothetical protein